MLHDTSKKIRYVHSFLRRNIVHVNLQLLYSCNFRCTICDFWRSGAGDKGALSVEQVRIISKKLAAIGPQVVSIGGGEPLLHKDIINVVQILAENNFPVMICNGWYVTPDMARALFEAGMYEVSISVDYATAAKHDAQRGMKGAFDKAIDALSLLNENRIYSHQRVHMISVVLDDNLDDLEQLIKLAKSLGITYMVTLYSNNRGKKENRYPDRDVSAYLLSLKSKYKEFVALRGYIGRFSEAIQNDGIAPCYAVTNLINIDASGRVSFCIDDLENTAGNILTDDINIILKNLVRQKQHTSCKGCWTSCRGSIETLMYGKNKIASLLDYYQMTRGINISANPDKGVGILNDF